MAKKEETTPVEGTVAPKIEEKVEKKVEAAVSEGAPKGAAQNIIGEVKPPEDLNDKEEVRAYFKKIDTKLDQLLGSHPAPKKEEPTVTPPPTSKKESWYDKALF